MNRLISLSSLILTVLLGFGQAQTVVESTVPGDGLRWETNALKLAISVVEPSELSLEVYSPHFDPDDYRAEQEGRPELGDERYDKNQGEVEANFVLERNGRVIQEASYGVSPHETVTFFSGELPAGEYSLSSSFKGLAKNAFIYTLHSDKQVSVFVDTLETQLFNIQRGDFQTPFVINVPEGEEPLQLEVYDGDGAEELVGRLLKPNGSYENLEISADRQWQALSLDEPGRYSFEYYVPETAFQYSNTIGVRVDKRLRVDDDGLTAVSPKAKFTLEKTVDKTVVMPGDSLTYRIRVSNIGGAIGSASLEDKLPEGLEGEDLSEAFDLPAGATRTFELDATVTDRALVLASNDAIVNRAVLRTDSEVLEQSVSILVSPLPEPVMPPAEFSLTKRVEPKIASVGEEVTFTITVSNTGGSVGKVALADVLPRGLSGEFTTMLIELGPGESQSFKISGTVLEDAPDLLVNYAAIASTSNDRALARADVSVRRGPANFVVTKTADKSEAAVGEDVQFDIRVSNIGAEPGEVRLVDALPAGMQGDSLDESFVLAAGESRRFTVFAKVLETAPKLLVNEARIISEQGEFTAVAFVRLGQAAVTPGPGPTIPDVAEGEFPQLRFSRVNLHYQAGEILSCDLGDLAPGESKTVAVRYQASGMDAQSQFTRSLNVAGLQVEELGLADTDQGYRVRVSNPGNERVESVTLIEPLPLGTRLVEASYVCSGALVDAKRVLVSHLPPEGAQYEAGSAMAEGEEIADPFVDAEGRLYFVLPYKTKGYVSYLLSHSGPLPEITDPSLTVETSKGELFLVDRVSFASVPKQSLAPALNAPTRSGIEVRPITAIADKRNPLVFEIEVAENAEASEVAYLSIESNLEPLKPDAVPDVAGYQIVMKDGKALLSFEPQVSPTTLELSLAYPGERVPSESLKVFIPGVTEGLYQYQASVTLSTAGGFSAEAEARAYAELPFGPGSLQTAVDIGAGLDSGSVFIDSDRGLRDEQDPGDRFPLTGAGQEAEPALRSDDGFAFRYDMSSFSAGYYADSLSIPGIEGLPRATALRAETHGDLQIEGFAALLPRGIVNVDVVPDGTRYYRLGAALEPASERLVLITLTPEGEIETPLERLKDYSINYASGLISLAKPLWRIDENFNPRVLRVSYAPVNTPRDQLAVGLGASYEAGNFTVALGAASLDFISAGAQLSYLDDDLYASVSYRLDLDPEETDHTVGLTAGGQFDAFSFSVDLSYDGKVRGLGRVAYRILPGGQIALVHEGSVTTNRSALQYEQRLGAFLVGAGVDYTWVEGAIGGVGLLGLQTERFDLNLRHSQPLDSSKRSKSTLNADYAIDANLSAQASVAYEWGNGLEGLLGLNQAIGSANFSVDYQLPTLSGEGNRARFGVDVPLPLTDRLYLDAFAGYSASFVSSSSEAAFGVAARYQGEAFKASLGTEIALPDTGGTKIVWRAGIAGQVAKNQTLSADANVQTSPFVEGEFTVAYALKTSSLNVLTYHRLERSGPDMVLEGELAPTWSPSNAFQVRPDLAYRVKFNDAIANTYQASLFAMYYFEIGGRANNDDFIPYSLPYKPQFGLGGGAVYLLQPGTSTSKLGLGLEASVQVIDPVWITLGYLFDQNFGGLTPETKGGVYLRLDLLGGGQY